MVQRTSTVLGSLATAGSRGARDQASALKREQVGTNRIAALSGVTRRRLSARLKGPDADGGSAGRRRSSDELLVTVRRQAMRRSIAL
jgi:hypothetical protein